MFPQDEIERRRRAQEALNRGLQRSQSFMPGESAGMPDSFWREKFPFLRNLPQPNAPLGDNDVPARPLVTVPSNAGLSLPQPTNPNINIAGIEPPIPSQPITPLPAPRIGYSMEGLTGLDRLMQRRRALEEADAESKVTETGEILPPQKTGRWKGLGQGLAIAGAQADPDRPMYALGQLIGGGLGGVISPRSSAKNARRIELDRLDNDIARGIKLETGQAELERLRNPVKVGVPHYESDADGNLLTIQGGRAQKVLDESGQPVRVKSKNAAGEVVEVDVGGRTLRVTPGQALDYYGAIGAREDKRDAENRERQSRYEAAKSEYDSLVAAEIEAGKQKDAAFKILDDMRKSGQPKEDVEQADQAAKAAQAYYQSFGEKKKDAARRMMENQVQSQGAQLTPSPTSPPAPPGVTEASVRAEARRRGANEDEAVRKAREFGWIK